MRNRDYSVSVTDKDPKTHMQEMAWIGDAVLALWARQWLLKEDGKILPGRFTRLPPIIFSRASAILPLSRRASERFI